MGKRRIIATTVSPLLVAVGGCALFRRVTSPSPSGPTAWHHHRDRAQVLIVDIIGSSTLHHTALFSYSYGHPTSSGV
jgi:hypothetical protein